MKTALLLLALAAAVQVAVSAPSAEASGSPPSARADQQHRQAGPKARQQAPGGDILTQVSEAFQEHVVQKLSVAVFQMQRFTDVLGSLGIRVPVPNVAESLPTGIVNMAHDIADEEEA